MWEGSFIVDLWERIFRALSKISWFYLVKRFYLRGKVTHDFVDKWVLANTVLSILGILVLYLIPSRWVVYSFIVYGSIRIFEVIVYQVNVLLFDPYRAYRAGKEYSIKSPIRTVILLLHNLLEIIAWYAVVYMGIAILNNGALTHGPAFYFMGSALCMTTFDPSISSEIAPGTALSIIKTVAFFEVETGIIMTVISLARFLGLLPDVSPKS
ncbi:hypothetical protein FH039_01190 [Thermococcus indicus]|uniref:Potassium channel domain-containing protein n=1 Tax=Thermococcus indicus TaxID=2586643 RepID=A0A4Y5SIB3_9EURY|nr:hypothetical protein [Thermococcus indicus]QDA30503.1 hypothetical protein FH039_01190 [Thermococcus indicus]